MKYREQFAFCRELHSRCFWWQIYFTTLGRQQWQWALFASASYPCCQAQLQRYIYASLWIHDHLHSKFYVILWIIRTLSFLWQQCPADNDRYVKNCRNGRSPKETRWWFHDDKVWLLATLLQSHARNPCLPFGIAFGEQEDQVMQGFRLCSSLHNQVSVKKIK